jgi:hypothetical protein
MIPGAIRSLANGTALVSLPASLPAADRRSERLLDAAFGERLREHGVAGLRGHRIAQLAHQPGPSDLTRRRPEADSDP